MSARWKNAIGPRDADFVVIENQWARVYVANVENEAGRMVYTVSGEPECSRQDFQSITSAIAEAVRVLALYQDGRAD